VLPGPLLHKFVEEMEKKRVVVVARCARTRNNRGLRMDFGGRRHQTV
jgi:hypothetical protein